MSETGPVPDLARPADAPAQRSSAGYSIVAANEVDLATVDPALVIDHGEVGGLRLADGA